MDPLQQWPDDAFVMSQAANVSVCVATKEQRETFLRAMERTFEDLLYVWTGIHIPDISFSDQAAIHSFLFGSAGAELVAHNSEVEIFLKRRDWGFLVVAVTFRAPTLQ